MIIAEHKRADPESRERGVSLFTSTVRRGSPDYLDPRLNSHSKQHEVQALIQALEAGVWAPHWYESVHRSTGFEPYTPKTGPLPEHLEDLLAACEPIYEKLVAEG